MARRAGLNFKISACDRSAHALDYARQSADRKQAAIHFFEWNLSENSFPSDYDVVMCSLFLHHQGEDQAVELLKSMRKTAHHLVLVNDLVRSIRGYFLAWLGTRVLTASDVVHVDGPRSVAAAFTVQEAQALATRAGLDGVTVTKSWPCRFLLVWERR
jgi:2-polyprenyl-3-methyl-5-hydroxy-6-metoxy-1,4-benzoquinol methylase